MGRNIGGRGCPLDNPNQMLHTAVSWAICLECFSSLVGSLVASVLISWFGQGLLNMCFPWILVQGIITSDPVY